MRGVDQQAFSQLTLREVREHIQQVLKIDLSGPTKSIIKELVKNAMAGNDILKDAHVEETEGAEHSERPSSQVTPLSLELPTES